MSFAVHLLSNGLLDQCQLSHIQLHASLRKIGLDSEHRKAAALQTTFCGQWCYSVNSSRIRYSRTERGGKSEANGQRTKESCFEKLTGSAPQPIGTFHSPTRDAVPTIGQAEQAALVFFKLDRSRDARRVSTYDLRMARFVASLSR